MILNPIITAHLVAEARELLASPRWQYPDTPGAAQIVELSERLCSPMMYRAFQRCVGLLAPGVGSTGCG
jgi:hypothetical protein